MTSEARIEGIKDIKLTDVFSVYSGKDGKCCCGCSGKYSYAKAHQAFASKHRGYAVTDDEINDKMVRKVYGLLLANLETADYCNSSETVSASFVIGQRLYVVYARGWEWEGEAVA